MAPSTLPRSLSEAPCTFSGKPTKILEELHAKQDLVLTASERLKRMSKRALLPLIGIGAIVGLAMVGTVYMELVIKSSKDINAAMLARIRPYEMTAFFLMLGGVLLGLLYYVAASLITSYQRANFEEIVHYAPHRVEFVDRLLHLVRDELRPKRAVRLIFSFQPRRVGSMRWLDLSLNLRNGFSLRIRVKSSKKVKRKSKGRRRITIKEQLDVDVLPPVTGSFNIVGCEPTAHERPSVENGSPFAGTLNLVGCDPMSSLHSYSTLVFKRIVNHGRGTRFTFVTPRNAPLQQIDVAASVRRGEATPADMLRAIVMTCRSIRIEPGVETHVQH